MKTLKFNQLASAFALLSVSLFPSCSEDDTTVPNLISEGNTVTMRNTYNDSHVPEVSFSSYLDYAFMGSDVEFPTALKVQLPGEETALINALYSINFTADRIDFTLLPEANDPFWSTKFRTLEEGVKDRYYLTFDEPHNVAGFTATDPAVNVRVDSETVLVVEVGEGFVFQPGAAFSISLEAKEEGNAAIQQGENIAMRNTYNDSHVPEISFALYVDYAMQTSLGEGGLDVTSTVVYEGVALGEDGLDETSAISNNLLEFPEALKADLTQNGGFMVNGLYSIDFTEENTIEYTLIASEDDPFWITNYRVLEEGVYDRYYYTFDNPHNVSSFTATDPAVNVRIDSDKVLVVEIGEGFDFKPGAAFTITLK